MDLNNYQHMVIYINQFGLLAPGAAFFLFALQAFLPIVPYAVLAAAAGFLFGFKQGVILAWSGALTGASLTYWLCRRFGINSFFFKYYERYSYDLSKISPGSAFWTIIIARVIPVIPTPLINIGAALGGVSFPTFLAASALGKLPTAFLYTGLGLALFQAQDVQTILLITAGVLALILLLKYAAGRWLQPKFYK
ncbi:MAG: TVP38/TMEM64 family protein [Peptococcaceae bacterium]|nr:TVP38/TMEM64 family protein [Peptococcaceae bacterium]